MLHEAYQLLCKRFGDKEKYSINDFEQEHNLFNGLRRISTSKNKWWICGCDFRMQIEGERGGGGGSHPKMKLGGETRSLGLSSQFHNIISERGVTPPPPLIKGGGVTPPQIKAGKLELRVCLKKLFFFAGRQRLRRRRRRRRGQRDGPA